MASDFSRTERFGQEIKKEVALILMREFKDPRLGMVTVSDAEVSRDLGHAKVFVSFFEDDKEKVEANMQILNEAAGFIRSLLAKRIRSRTMPQLHFFFDSSLTEGIRMTNLVNKAIEEDKSKRGDDEE